MADMRTVHDTLLDAWDAADRAWHYADIGERDKAMAKADAATSAIKKVLDEFDLPWVRDRPPREEAHA